MIQTFTGVPVKTILGSYSFSAPPSQALRPDMSRRTLRTHQRPIFSTQNNFREKLCQKAKKACRETSKSTTHFNVTGTKVPKRYLTRRLPAVLVFSQAQRAVSQPTRDVRRRCSIPWHDTLCSAACCGHTQPRHRVWMWMLLCGIPFSPGSYRDDHERHTW